MRYLIWSVEHDAWWRPGKVGYTNSLALAGQYAEDDARAILARANFIRVNECLIPVSAIDVSSLDNINAVLNTICDHESSAALTDDDRERIKRIARADDSFLDRMRDYYGDADRAARTPRGILYLHLGMTIGLLEHIRRELDKRADSIPAPFTLAENRVKH